jgi:outer membrane receptor for ferrienterochelin and colicins
MNRYGSPLANHSLIAIAVLAAWTSPHTVMAEETPGGTVSAAETQRVEVTSSSADGDRSSSTAANLIVTRDDLDKFNDANAIDVLRRIPGVSVSGNGRAAEIRLHGLGGGYVQILVNGQPAPDGFTLDSIAPALIERIEVQSTPSLDQTAHGIAGTINVITRQPAAKPTRQLKASVGGHTGNPSGSLDGFYSGVDGKWRYSLAGSLARDRTTFPMTYQQDEYDSSGAKVFSDHTDRKEWYVNDTLALAPNIKWTLDPKRFLTIDSLIRERHSSAGTVDTRTLLLGAPPMYASDDLEATLDSSLVRTKLSWHQDFDNTSSLEVKLGYTDNRRHTNSTFFEYSPDQLQTLLDERVHGLAIERDIATSGKFNLPLTNEHSMAVGWDGDFIHRAEDRIQRQTAPAGYPATDLDQIYSIRVDRLASYAQDEWQASRGVSVYWGARWEGLETHVRGNDIQTVANVTNMLSPTAQVAWQIGGSSGDKFRASLARTYNVPTVQDLNPRRFVSNDNTPTTPDLEGNPDLRPERSLGIDLSIEHYFGKSGGMLSVSGLLRRISNVIVHTSELDGDSWVNSPHNAGTANVEGLGLEGRFALAELESSLPALDLHFNVNWNHSHVSDVPSPHNRLDRQTPFTMGAGFDYAISSTALKLGANYTFDGGGPVTLEQGQVHNTHPNRNLDAYATWSMSRQTQVRFSGNHLTGRNTIVDDTVADGDGYFQQRSITTVARTWKIALEQKF